jgi:hypothetical protein
MSYSAEIADAWLTGDEQGQDTRHASLALRAYRAHSAISRRIVMNNASP